MARPRDRVRDDERLRLFFALELGEAARATSLACIDRLRAQPGGDAVRWVKRENLHVTLRFLGSTAQARVAGLVAEMADRVAALPRFPLELGAVAAFPTPRRPRVVVRAIAPTGPLRRLASTIEAGVRAAGFDAETRAFRPHLTLGRLRRGRRPGTARDAFPDVTVADTPLSETVPVTEIILFRSELHPSGSRYDALARLPLAPGAAPTSSSP